MRALELGHTMAQEQAQEWQDETRRIYELQSRIDQGGRGLVGTIRGARVYGHEVEGKGRMLVYFDYTHRGTETVHDDVLSCLPNPALRDVADYVEAVALSPDFKGAYILKERRPPKARRTVGDRMLGAPSENNRGQYPWKPIQ